MTEADPPNSIVSSEVAEGEHPPTMTGYTEDAPMFQFNVDTCEKHVSNWNDMETASIPAKSTPYYLYEAVPKATDQDKVVEKTSGADLKEWPNDVLCTETNNGVEAESGNKLLVVDVTPESQKYVHAVDHDKMRIRWDEC